MTCSLAPAQAFAQYELKELTPAVQSALEGRKGRFGQLASLKQQGAVGENSSGYVTVLADTDGAAALAEAENRDRKVIYTAIAEQNGLLSEMSSIEKVFAQVQRDKAAAGEKIQLENGEWTTK
jgi:uncharacterized protein YdbL (DUF1318 family)